MKKYAKDDRFCDCEITGELTDKEEAKLEAKKEHEQEKRGKICHICGGSGRGGQCWSCDGTGEL